MNPRIFHQNTHILLQILKLSVIKREISFGDKLRGIEGTDVRPIGRLDPERSLSELNISHLGIDKEITLTNEYSSQYNAGLGDGRRGTLNHRDNHWQGYHGVNFEATIDLGALTPINEISCSFLQKHSAWIFLPTEVHFQLSKDGNDFFSIKKFKEETIADPSYKVKDYVSTFSQT